MSTGDRARRAEVEARGRRQHAEREWAAAEDNANRARNLDPGK